MSKFTEMRIFDALAVNVTITDMRLDLEQVNPAISDIITEQGIDEEVVL